MELNNAYLDLSTLDQTLPKNSGLMCGLDTRLKRYLLKEKVCGVIADKKRRFFAALLRANRDESAADEFEVKRFTGDLSSSSSSDTTTDSDSFGQNQTRVYFDVHQRMQRRQSSALDNLKLQSRVYRDEINSLKKQIDCLRWEKLQLESDNTQPDFANRRRSHIL